MSIHHIAFDIETAPLPEAELKLVTPEFKAPKTYKDPAKIEESIRQQQQEWVQEAALSAVTGRIVAIGYNIHKVNGPSVFEADWSIREHPEGERKLLENFWDRLRVHKNQTWVGFRIHGFDLPFIIRRSWKHQVPMLPMADLRTRGYWHPRFVDIQVEWQLGDRQAGGSLDTVSKHLGTGAKNGNGADFFELLKTNSGAAIEYLANDCILTTRNYLAMLGPY